MWRSSAEKALGKAAQARAARNRRCLPGRLADLQAADLRVAVLQVRSRPAWNRDLRRFPALRDRTVDPIRARDRA